jgi:hypothetical protein
MTTRRAAIVTSFLVMGVFGCSASTDFTRRGPELPAGPPTCKLAVANHPVVRSYEQLGVIDIAAFHAKAVPRTEADFVEVVTEDACSAGADAVIPVIDGSGRYIQAVVIRWTPQTKPTVQTNGGDTTGND